MAIHTTSQTLIFIHYHEFQGFCNEIDLTAEAAAEDASVFNNNGWSSVLAGLKTGKLTLKGFQDHTLGEDVIVGAQGLDNLIVTVSPPQGATPEAQRAGVVAGDTCYFTRGGINKRTAISGQVGKIAPFDLEIDSGRMPLVRGIAMTSSSSAKTASGNTGMVQQGAFPGFPGPAGVPAGKRLYAALHTFSVSGTSPTMDLKVQSDDNSTPTSPTDRITFTQVTSGGFFEQVASVAGPITDDYWRLTWTIGGTSPSFRFCCSIGII